MTDFITKFLDSIPRGPLGFAGDGRAAGMVGDVLRDAMEKYVPTAPTDVEIRGTEPGPGESTRYYVNVVAWIEKVGEVRAILEALPGKLNFATDRVEVQNVEVVRDRPLRKTFEVTVDVYPRVDVPTLR